MSMNTTAGTQTTFDVVALCQQARLASRQLAQLGEGEKNQLLLAMADALLAATSEILQQNQIDMTNAVENQLAEAMQDRLLLTNISIGIKLLELVMQF